MGLDDPRLDELIGSQVDELRNEVELLEGASIHSKRRLIWQDSRHRFSSAAPSTPSAFSNCWTPSWKTHLLPCRGRR